MSAATEPPPLPRGLAQAAERALRRRFGGHPRIALQAPLEGRGDAFRCHVEGPGAPESVIVKSTRPASEGQGAGGPDQGWLLTNEWAALALLDALQERAGGPRVSPRFYGGDRDLGVLVFEDLGDGPTLVDALLGNARPPPRRRWSRSRAPWAACTP